ncbi:hypothetical protein NBRC10512v2_002118 [Rhodotorula toruloides]
MELVTAFSTPTAREKSSALMRWPAIAVARVEEEVPGKVARSALNKAASVTPSLFCLDSTFDATITSSSTPRLNCRQGLGGRRAGPLWVKVDVIVALAFEWQLLQHVDRRRRSSGFNPAWSVERRSTAPTRFCSRCYRTPAQHISSKASTRVPTGQACLLRAEPRTTVWR